MKAQTWDATNIAYAWAIRSGNKSRLLFESELGDKLGSLDVGISPARAGCIGYAGMSDPRARCLHSL
jgi:hypothetical protein